MALEVDHGERRAGARMAALLGCDQAHDPGESLCKVLWTDGAAEIESPAAGVMRLIATEQGGHARTGATLAVIDLEGHPSRGGLRHLFR